MPLNLNACNLRFPVDPGSAAVSFGPSEPGGGGDEPQTKTLGLVRGEPMIALNPALE